MDSQRPLRRTQNREKHITRRVSTCTLLLGYVVAMSPLCAPSVIATCSTQALTIRIAVIGPVQPSASSDIGFGTIEQSLRASAAWDSQFVLVERGLIQSALAGIEYDGSINLAADEARRLGAVVGCDFFITGKAEILSRSERAGESHQEALVGVMIVDGRSGKLITFDFLCERGATADLATQSLRRALGDRASFYLNEMAVLRQPPLLKKDNMKDSGTRATSLRGGQGPAVEKIIDLPDEDSPRSAGLTPPEFLTRIKPDYPDQAMKADISAVVEAKVVLKATTEIGDIEITRWAGFGLENSAIHAIRQLKFKPAMRDGKPISVRVTVRYNFRRIDPGPIKPRSSSAP